MKKVLLFAMLFFTTNIFAQGAEEIEQELENATPTTPLFNFFHMYMEYGSGELSAPLGDRILENLDVKMTYNQNFNNARWLSLGFVAQVSWNFGVVRLLSGGFDTPISKLAIPSNMNLTATIGFLNNIITLGASSEGIASFTVYYNRVLPTVRGLYSHDITVLFAPSFFMMGNQFGANGMITTGWFDKLEMRIAYRMKFNQYVGFRPEVLFNFTGVDLLNGFSLNHAFTFRFNPRLQFYAGEFSFFIEPRFFYFGNPALFANKENFQWEIKVGFDIAKFTIR